MSTVHENQYKIQKILVFALLTYIYSKFSILFLIQPTIQLNNKNFSEKHPFDDCKDNSEDSLQSKLHISLWEAIILENYNKLF